VIRPELIERLLPHRPPMLLVDEVTEVVPGERMTARRTVRADEPWYRAASGPYPAVLLIESWCQAAGLLVAWPWRETGRPADLVMLFGSMTEVVLNAPVYAGDVVEHRIRLVREVGDSAIFEGEANVDGRPVMTVGRVVTTMRPTGALAPSPSSDGEEHD
jgi:3-hydroxyacyl-[acyl-carrier-protein] dehydratase